MKINVQLLGGFALAALLCGPSLAHADPLGTFTGWSVEAGGGVGRLSLNDIAFSQKNVDGAVIDGKIVALDQLSWGGVIGLSMDGSYSLASKHTHSFTCADMTCTHLGDESDGVGPHFSFGQSVIAGWALGPVLAYVNGGFEVTQINASADVNNHGFSPDNHVRNSTTVYGPRFGAGIMLALTEGIRLDLNYQHTDFVAATFKDSFGTFNSSARADKVSLDLNIPL
jgi:opacity protein-like surface antigen